MIPNIIVPDVKPDERLQEATQDLYRQWRVGYDEAHPVPGFINVVFAHDPRWRENLVSIQAAHDWHQSVFWTCVAVAFFLGQFAFAAAPMIARLF